MPENKALRKKSFFKELLLFIPFSEFSLRTFEIFGCFNVSAAGIKRLGQKCPNLQTLNLGQCYKVSIEATTTLQ